MEIQKYKILMIAYYSPPVAASGTLRTLDFIRHLSGLGWKIHLLTVKPNQVHQINERLLENVHSSIAIYRVTDVDFFKLNFKKCNIYTPTVNNEDNDEALAQRRKKKMPKFSRIILSHITSFLKTPDLQLGWFLPSILKCLFVIKKPDILYTSAPPFTGHLVGVFGQYLWGVPLICDFRDPWADNPFRFVREGWVGQWDRWLEKLVLTRADLVIANTEKVASLFRQRYPKFADKVDVIPNGYDPDNFLEVQPIRHYSLDYLVLVHAGFLYGERDPTNFFKAVQWLIRNNDCPRLRVLLVGSSTTNTGQPLDEFLSDWGLSDYVQCQPTVPHGMALSLMKGADGLLLISTGTLLQVPAKLFEYLGLEKPILSVAELGSATVEITDQLRRIVYPARNTPESIQQALIKLYSDWLVDNRFERLKYIDNEVAEFLKSMTRQSQAKKLSQHCHRLVSGID